MPFVDSAVSGQESGASSYSLSLTTSNSDNIIVVLAYAENNSSSNPSISGVSATGLTFALRARSHSSASGDLELWWAYASDPGTYDITISYDATFDDASAVAAAITGCNTSSPWDDTASQIGSGTFPPTYTVSTSADRGVMLYGVGTADGSGFDPRYQPQPTPAGFLALPDSYNSGGSNYADVLLTIKPFGSSPSGATVEPSNSSGGDGDEGLFEVLVAAAPVAGQADPPSLSSFVATINGGDPSFTVTLPGVTTGDVVCLLAYAEMGGAQPEITSVTATGLTFALRSRSHGSGIGDLELWWATAAADGDYDIAFTYAASIDDGSFTAFSVSGTDPAGPWDDNAAASQTQGGVNVPSFTVSTTATSALLIAAGGAAASGQSAGMGPAGFLPLPGGKNGGGSLYSNNVLAVKSVVEAQSGAVFTWQDSVSMTNDGAEALFDAMRAAPAAGGGPVDPTAVTKQGQSATGSAKPSIDVSGGTGQGQSDTSLMLIANASHVSGAASTKQAQEADALGEARLDWSLIDRVQQDEGSSVGSITTLPPHDIAEKTHVVIAVAGFSSDLPTSVTDSAGNVYTLVVSQSHIWPDTIAQSVAIYAALNLHTYAGNVVTVHWSANPGRRTVLAYYFSSPLRAVIDAFASAIVDSADNITSSTLTTTTGSGFVIGVEHAHGIGSFAPDSTTVWTPTLDGSFTDDIGYATDGYKVYRSNLNTAFTMQGTEPTRHRLIAMLAVGDGGPQVFTNQGQKANGAASQVDIAETAHTFQSQGAVAVGSSRDKFRVYDSQSHAQSYTGSSGAFAMPPMDVIAGKHLVVGITFLDAPSFPQTYTITDSDGGDWTLLAHESYLLPGSSDQRSFHHMWWLSTNRRQSIGNVVTLHSTYSPTSFAFSEIQFESDFMPKLDTHVGAIFQPYSYEAYADITTDSLDGGLLLMSTQGGSDQYGFFTEGRVTGDPSVRRYPDPNSHVVGIPGDYSISSPLFGYEVINSNLTGATRSHWGNRGDFSSTPSYTARSISLVALKVDPSAMVGSTTQVQSASGTASVTGDIVSDMTGGGAQGQKLLGTMVVSVDMDSLTAQVQSVSGSAGLVSAGGTMTVQVQSVTAVGSTSQSSAVATSQGQQVGAASLQGSDSSGGGAQAQTSQINAVVAVLVDVGGIQAQSASGALGLGVSGSAATGEAQSTSAAGGTAIAATNSTAQGQKATALVGLAISFDVATGQMQVASGNARAEVNQSVVVQQAQVVQGVLGAASVTASATAQGQQAGAAAGTAADGEGSTAQAQRMGQGLSQLQIVFDVTVVTSQAQGAAAVSPVQFVQEGGDLVAHVVNFRPSLSGDVFTRPLREL